METALAYRARRASRGDSESGTGRDATVEAITNTNIATKIRNNLPGIALPRALKASTDMARALGWRRGVLLVTRPRTCATSAGRCSQHTGADVTRIALVRQGSRARHRLSAQRSCRSKFCTVTRSARLSGPTFAKTNSRWTTLTARHHRLPVFLRTDRLETQGLEHRTQAWRCRWDRILPARYIFRRSGRHVEVQRCGPRMSNAIIRRRHE